MKKILILGIIGLMGITGARAQFDDYGVKVGLGSATLTDDLSTKSPTLGVNLGGYINLGFKHSQTALAEIFYLQTGLNLVRRGNSFEEFYEHGNTLAHREGYHHIWYLQLPVLAAVHFELPVRDPGHWVGFYLGPAVSFGLFGAYADRMVTPGYTSRNANYDVNFSGTAEDRQLFNHISRLDVSAVFGITYERGRYTVSLFVDHGFIAVSKGEDILRIIENTRTQILDQINNTNTQPTDVEIPNGNNSAIMLSLSYKLGSFLK